MSKLLVLAPTGIGKTSSLRNLPPEYTGIINADRKELPIRGWRKLYKTVRAADGKVDFAKSNYLETASPANVLYTLQQWNSQPNIKNIVVDTISHVVTNDYMNNTIGKDFKAYQKLGKNFYDILDFIAKCEKNIIIMGHIEKKINDFGDQAWVFKSHGNMITDLVPPSYFTTVVVGEKLKKKDGGPADFDYVFRTQSLGDDPAKSPAYFTDEGVKTALELYEPNDIALILEKLEMFETTV